MTLTTGTIGQIEMKVPETLGELPDFNIARYGEITLLYYEGHEFTNTQLLNMGQRLAAGLKNLGVQKGDRVVIMMINSPEVLVAMQAISRLGAVIVPLLPVLKTPEVQHIASNCTPKAVIANLMLAPVIKPALEAAGLSDTTLIAVGNSNEAKAAGLVSYSDLVAESEPLTTLSDVSPDDPAVMIYTSGTTGKPKGVVLTNHNLIFTYTSASNLDHITGRAPREPQPALIVLPLAHAFGLAVIHTGYFTGDPMVLVPKFELPKVYSLFEKHSIYTMGAVPAMLVGMLHHPDAGNYKYPNFNYVVSGAAPLPESVLYGFQKKFGAIIREGYGLSESTVAVANHRDGVEVRPGSVGKPLSGVEVKIAGPTGEALPTGERGEICVKGENVMLGYYNNPEATAATIRDGWLHTGDAGYLDGDGYLYIVERLKDMIIRGGLNVYPRDVEEVIMQHPAVLETAVIGVPSETMGEEVKAFVVLKPGQTATTDEIRDHCQKQLANFKTPSMVQFIEALPRNTVGKILKTELRKIPA